MNITQLSTYLSEHKHPDFRRKQIIKGIVQDGCATYAEITTIPRALQEELLRNVPILPFTVVKIHASQDGRAIKALLQLTEGKHMIETVLISPKPQMWSACISSQVGCAMGCAFCATGKLGLVRNLTTDEITSQVLLWRQYLKQHNIIDTFANIVYMGMGEPFMNWKNVKESIDILTDKDLFGFANRGLSISTSGIVSGIMDFADTCPQINLAISLHFVSDAKRTKYMPVNNGYDLSQLRHALQYYLSKNKRKIFIEYIMLKGINDTPEDARLLAQYVASIGHMQLLHINLIRYNAIGENFSPSERETVKKFQSIMQKAHIPCTIRKSVGDDISGACGQLAGK
ncbi:MAG: 23S rRNA (adenine(2503)-C(2))-methyltransferase RlmN [Parcubacteria group bacterium]|jgi:23S rRNA (adenine(2503)-C(2))-methyltransferase